MPLMIDGDDSKLDWTGVVDALSEGHRLPKAHVEDLFLGTPDKTLLSRGAWIPGLGFGSKTVSVFRENTKIGLPSIQGAMQVFSADDGRLEAIVNSTMVTKWKTAGDSVLGAKLLARPDSRILLIAGTGAVAASLVQAYSEVFPGLEKIILWGRTASKANALCEQLTSKGFPVATSSDLAASVASADIVSTATMSVEPVLKGDWVRPGTHVDLIGAFKADMREADDALMSKGRLFVDSRETTLHHIGELMTPLKSGVLSEKEVLADLYELTGGAAGRLSDEDITIFKNGGGAHLDLMTAKHIISKLARDGD